MPKQPDQAALIEVELLKDHAHNGELLDAGAKIQVDAPTAEYMVAHGVVAAYTKPEAAPEEQAGTFTE